ncbi:RloB family protein [Desulfococcaceae bacterium HSG9]|nr:RloB family protein [Desulfococcaceae bacterium HSG9]
MPKKRLTNRRKPNKRILILCEGRETEPNYFKGLKHDKYHRNKLAALRIEIYDSNKNTGKELVAEAKSLKKIANAEKNSYDAIWIVIDKDGYTKHPQTFDQANANKINIAFSSISFEFWFLLHFTYTTKAFHKSADLERHLRFEYMQNYEKYDDNYSKLKDKTDQAIGNAKKIQKYSQNDLNRGRKIYELNPYTDVDVLVQKLLSL